MHLMVCIKDIYIGGDTEGDVPLIHLRLHYGFWSLLPWVTKSLSLGHQLLNLLHPWLIFTPVLVFPNYISHGLSKVILITQ